MQIKNKIIGLMISIGILSVPTNALALYSPIISAEVATIKEHILSARIQSGPDTVLENIETIKAMDDEARAKGYETGLPGSGRAATKMVLLETFDEVISNPFDSLLMVFNINGNVGFISNCLRDDIWELELLRDLVGAEMIKSFMILDNTHGMLLREDWHYLVQNISLLKKYGHDPIARFWVQEDGIPDKITSSEYFFGFDADINYYKATFPTESGCPEFAFEAAAEQVARSAKVLGTAFSSGGGADWDLKNIWEAAKAGARVNARKWIASNQMSLTIGGESGARQQSLVKGGGWDRFVGNMKVQWKIAKDMAGPVTELWQWKKYIQTSEKPNPAILSDTEHCVYYVADQGVFQDCNQEQIGNWTICKGDDEEAKAEVDCHRYLNIEENESLVDRIDRNIRQINELKAVQNQIELAFTYNMNLDQIGKEAIKDIDRIMFLTNKTIQRGYEGVDSNAGEALPTLLKRVKILEKNHCPNKTRGASR